MSYLALIRTLDSLRNEAPKNFKSYYPKVEEVEKLNQARAAAFIHLFLKVRFGMGDFVKRHENICDGSQDGGVDGYFIDTDNRCITLVQSKFRTTEKNFEEKSIDLCFREGVGPFLFYRILGCQDKKWLRKLMRDSSDSDLLLLHRFKQGRLDLGSSSIDLVSEDNIGHDRSHLGIKGL